MLQSLYSLAATGSFCWFLASSLWIYPHSLSYFNESVGGPLNGPQHLLGSCVDWGQDLRYLKCWNLEHSEILKERPYYLAYFGFIQPVDVGFSEAQSWPQEERTLEISATSLLEIEQDTSGIYVVSLNLVKGYKWTARGSNVSDRNSFNDYLHELGEIKAFDSIGYSMRVFDRR